MFLCVCIYVYLSVSPYNLFYCLSLPECQLCEDRGCFNILLTAEYHHLELYLANSR